MNVLSAGGSNPPDIGVHFYRLENQELAWLVGLEDGSISQPGHEDMNVNHHFSNA